MPTSLRGDDRVARQVQKQVGHAGGPGSGAGAFDGLLAADVLVVNQKAKFVEASNEYMVYDEHGTQVGAVRQVGQSGLRKAARLLTNVDQYLTHRLEVTDTGGRTLLHLTRPAKVFKSKVIVEDAAGTEVGRIKKTFEGIARAMFTTADNYVVRIHRPLQDPLRSLAVASALSVDTALKQDEN